jgi:hypothetical protein
MRPRSAILSCNTTVPRTAFRTGMNGGVRIQGHRGQLHVGRRPHPLPQGTLQPENLDFIGVWASGHFADLLFYNRISMGSKGFVPSAFPDHLAPAHSSGDIKNCRPVSIGDSF